MTLSGYTDALPDDVLLDSGVLYIGDTPYAASVGGLKFDPQKEVRNIEFDGKRTAIKGLDRTVGFAPVLSGTVLNFPNDALDTLEPGATGVTDGAFGVTGLKPKRAGLLYETGDYLANVRCIWERGDGTYVQVRFPAALVQKWDVQGTDKEEAKIAVEIGARLDMGVSGTNIGDAPYRVEYFSAAP